VWRKSLIRQLACSAQLISNDVLGLKVATKLATTIFIMLELRIVSDMADKKNKV